MSMRTILVDCQYRRLDAIRRATTYLPLECRLSAFLLLQSSSGSLNINHQSTTQSGIPEWRQAFWDVLAWLAACPPVSRWFALKNFGGSPSWVLYSTFRCCCLLP